MNSKPLFFSRFFCTRFLATIIFGIAMLPGILLAQDAAQPSKETLVKMLTKVAAQLEAKQYAEAQKYFYLPPDFKPEMMAQLTKRGVINSGGVEALSKGGEFGKAVGVLRKSDVEEVANEHSASLDDCYAMKMEQDGSRCKVIAHWTEGKFKILDINRVGKMNPNNVVATADVPVKPWPTGEKPSKELFIKTLEVFLEQIENKHYDALRPNVYVPENFVMSRFNDSLERKELSAAGIKILSQRGSYGKAIGVFHKLRAEALTKRVQVPADESYGMVAKIGGEEGEALAHWTGDRFKLLRTDDIGKLPEALAAETKAAATPKKENSPVPEMPAPKVASSPAAVKKPAVAKKPTPETAKLPKYETDKNVAMANYPALVQSVAANPNDVSLRAKFIQSLLVIGNTPKAWTEAVAIYAIAPENIEVVYAIDKSIEGLKKNGIFQVGVPTETIEALMGKPLKKVADGEGARWEYPIWHVEFNQGRFVKLVRTEIKKQAVKPAASAAKDAKKVEAVVEKPAKLTFNVELTSFGKSKVATIRVIRELNKGLSLRQAVKLVDNLPSQVLEGVSKEAATTAIEKLTAAGATASMK